MTVKMIFEDARADEISDNIWPNNSGHAIAVSEDTPTINRHDIRVTLSGGQTVVTVVGVDKSDFSQETLDKIINTVPGKHVQTADV